MHEVTRVLYIHYGNPGGYPPLEHSSAILAEVGAEVLVVGTTAAWMNRMAWPDRPGVTVDVMRRRESGAGQKIDYLRFAARAVHLARRHRPHWLYVSDATAAPTALLLRRLMAPRVLYHEHDEPFVATPSRFMRAVLVARKRLARVADEVVVPNAERGRRLTAVAARPREATVVWNCPRRSELRSNTAPDDGPLRLLYQGSIARERVPFTLVDMMARVPDVHLVVVGYEPPGAAGHLEALQQHAAARGVAGRLEILGEIPRNEILGVTSSCHVGLSFRAAASGDPNERTMVGPSNKAFEYLACGLPLLVGDEPEWREHFVEPGLARACDPMDVESLTQAVRWYTRNRDRLPDIGRRGQAKIRDDWNYESQFAPVLRMIVPDGAHTGKTKPL